MRAVCSYWVCEKSDGIRVLLFVQTDLKTKDQAIYLVRPLPSLYVRTRLTSIAPVAQIDRHNAYREVQGLYFPHHENPMMPLRSTMVDGELVVDTDPRTKQVCCCPLARSTVARADRLLV